MLRRMLVPHTAAIKVTFTFSTLFTYSFIIRIILMVHKNEENNKNTMKTKPCSSN